jgi:hypothetical protein
MDAVMATSMPYRSHYRFILASHIQSACHFHDDFGRSFYGMLLKNIFHIRTPEAGTVGVHWREEPQWHFFEFVLLLI